MFKPFVDKDIRRRFCIVIRNENDIDKLLDYLNNNNIKCVWYSKRDWLDKSKIMEYFASCKPRHLNLYLYFYYRENYLIKEIFEVTYDKRDRPLYNGNMVKCYTIDDILKGDNNMFTKNDLRTGMIVERRDSEKFVILLNCYSGALSEDIMVNERAKNWDWLSSYDDNLKYYSDDSEFDIMKVYQANHPYGIHTFDNLILIWEREEEPKEMTVKEIEKELGYPIKIVKE